MLEVLEQFRVIVRSIRRRYRDVAARPGLTVGKLAGVLAVHQSTASNLARRLQGTGLVRRERKGRDQRHVRLFTS